MSIRRLAVLIGMLVVGGVLTHVIVGFPVLKTSEYGALIRQYAEARSVGPTGTIDDELKWNVELPLADGGKARLQAGGHMDVVRLQLPGEAESRPLYEYEDYSNPIAVRIAGDRLFVYWSETLIRTDHWLLIYDMRYRREIERRRIDPRDMPSEQ